MRAFVWPPAIIFLLAAAAGCGGGGGGRGGSGGGGGGSGGGGASPPGQVSITLTPSDDTFINGRIPDNNNGASASIFTGVDGQDGTMRGLIQFTPPAALQGHATVTAVQLKMTIRTLGMATRRIDAVESLQAITEAWVQGNGVGGAAQSFTVGQTCSDTVTGATWNQPDCATGTTATWTTPGATVSATVSGQADTTGVPFDSPVVWDGAAASNAGMIADVQSWIDAPSGNHGWRITSSDEITAAAPQRFYSTEAGGTTVPTLTITYMP